MTEIRPRHVDWSEPVLPAVVRALADARGASGELDLSDHLLVLPGARSARRATELLVAEAEDRGLVLLPPRTATVGALPELLYRSERPLADGLLLRRLWARALRETPADQLELLLPDPPDADDLPGWAALGREVQRLYREVGAEGLAFGDVAGACRDAGLLFDDSDRWRLLGGVEARYLRALDALERTDRQRARRRALESDGVGLYWLYRDNQYKEHEPAIHLVGVVEMAGVAADMVRAAAVAGAEVVPWIHAPVGRADAFDDLGRVRPDAWAGARIPVADEALRFVGGPANEAAAAVRAVADFSGDRAPDDVVVGVADEGLVPWLAQRFSAHGVRTRWAEEAPLERTGPYRLLAAAADWLDGRRFPDLAALLRHPDLEARLATGQAPEAADAYFSTHLPGRLRGEPPGGGAAATEMREIVEELDGDGLLGPLRDDPRDLREWMPRILGLLERVYGAEALDRGVPAQRRIVEACEAVRDRAASFHRLPPAVDEASGAGAAIRLLLAELRGPADVIPPEPDPRAVEILGWLELHLDDAPDLVLTGATEPGLPSSLGADLFLPDRLRRVLGLPSDRTRYARDAYLLTALLHVRERVRVLAARRDADGNPVRPSRLLLTGPGEDVARRLLAFLKEDGAAATARPAAPLGLEAAAESGFGVPPEPRISLEGLDESFRVTEFRDLLADPYRWALTRTRRLEELHDRARELDPLAFGSLAHEVLERFGRSQERDAADPEVVLGRLEAILRAVVRDRYRASLPSVPVQVEQLRTRLRAFARWHADRVARGWRIEAVEAQPPEAVPFDVDGRPVRLRGRIDRIDVHEAEGRVAVFDYKSGERARDPEKAHRGRSGEWKDLQLPLYRHLLPHLVDDEGRPLAGGLVREAAREGAGTGALRLGYVLLPKEVSKVGHAFLEWGDDELRAADDEARRLVRWLREREWIEHDPDVTSTNEWDALGDLLGRGVLVTADASGEDGDDDGEADP